MMVCFYWSFTCVYLVTMATKFNKSRVKHLKMCENSFLESFAQILFTQMSMVVETHRDPRMALYHNTPRGYRG